MKRVGCKSLIQLRYTRSTRMVLGLSPRHIPTQALQIFLWDRVSRPPFPLMGAFSPLGCLSGRAAGNTLFCKAQLKIIIIITCVLPVIMPTKKKKKKEKPLPFYPGGSENPTIHGWGGGLRIFFLRKYSGARAFWGNICRLIKGETGAVIRQSDEILLLLLLFCVSL